MKSEKDFKKFSAKGGGKKNVPRKSCGGLVTCLEERGKKKGKGEKVSRGS